MPLTTLTTIDDLHAALARAATTTPLFLFKHSETCGMSWQAHEEVMAVLDDPAWEADIHLVSVQASRVVSNEIARRLQVRHASPQLLLVADGVVRWQATHLAITAAAIRKAAGVCGLRATG
jgi:bacillithiol system protein YtxJ